MKKKNSFRPGQIYTVFSRIKAYDKLLCTKQYKMSSIKVNEDARNEYERLKNHCIFSAIDRNAVSDDTLKTFILNVRSLAKDLSDIVHDYKCLSVFY